MVDRYSEAGIVTTTANSVYTSEIANATSLGAALVLWKGIDASFNPVIDLGLKLFDGDPSLVG